MIRNRDNAPHYRWGNDCDGWRLHEDADVGVIEELVSPGRGENSHRHSRAVQVFVILAGEATMLLETKAIVMRTGDALTVPAGVVHQFYNDSSAPVRFLVISAPRRDWDRIDEQPSLAPSES